MSGIHENVCFLLAIFWVIGIKKNKDFLVYKDQWHIDSMQKKDDYMVVILIH